MEIDLITLILVAIILVLAVACTAGVFLVLKALKLRSGSGQYGGSVGSVNGGMEDGESGDLERFGHKIRDIEHRVDDDPNDRIPSRAGKFGTLGDELERVKVDLDEDEVTAEMIFNYAYKKAVEAAKDLSTNEDFHKFNGQKWWQEGMKKYYAKYDDQTADWNPRLAKEIRDKALGMKHLESDAAGRIIESRHFAYQTLTQIGGEPKATPRKIAQLAMNVAWLQKVRAKGNSVLGPFQRLIMDAEQHNDLTNIKTYMDPDAKFVIKGHP